MEKQNLEQRCAIKFCVKLNENATETYEKLKRACGEHALSRTQVFRSHKHFWMAVRVWKTNLVLEDLARQKRMKMWPKWGISWGLIDVWQSEWSVVWWIEIAKPSTKFWPSNWTCRKFVPSWSQKFSPMKRRKTEGMYAWTSLNASKMTKIFQTCHTRWGNVDFLIRSWHQTSKFGVAHEQLTAAKESKNEQIKNQNHANLFFRKSRRCS